MLKKVLFLLFIYSAHVRALKLEVDKADAKITKNYFISDVSTIFERPSGISFATKTWFGEIPVNLNLQYKNADLVITNDHKINLTLRECTIPGISMAQNMLSKLAEKAAELFSMSNSLTDAEYKAALDLFKVNDAYGEIEKAPYRVQCKFLDLMALIQKKFPEVIITFRMPWTTRIVHKIKSIFA